MSNNKNKKMEMIYKFCRSVLSTSWNVSFVKRGNARRLVPMSALFSVVGTFSMIHVPSATFSLNQFSAKGRCLSPLVIWVVLAASTQALFVFLDDSRLLLPTHHGQHTTVCNYFTLESMVNCFDFGFSSWCRDTAMPYHGWHEGNTRHRRL